MTKEAEDNPLALASLPHVRSLKLTQKGDSIQWDITCVDRLKALEMLGREYGLFAHAAASEGKAPVTIVDDVKEEST